MKINKIMIVSLLLLAVMTLGAVSATDGLAAGETLDSLELSVDDADIIADDDDIGDDEINDDPGDGEGDELTDPQMNVTGLDEETYYLEDFAIVHVSLPDDATGVVTYYLNDEEMDWQDVSYDNTFDVYFDYFGNYSFEFAYSGDEVYQPASVSFEYELNNTQYILYFPEYVEYVEEYVYISAPSDFNGNMAVTVNGKKIRINKEDDDGYITYWFDASKLNFGKNSITVAYDGDEVFGPYDYQGEITLGGILYIPDGYEYASEDNCASLELPEDAEGTFTLYLGHMEDDEFIIDSEFASEDVIDGAAEICIDGLGVGVNQFMAVYEGNYNKSAYEGEIEVYPKIDIPPVIVLGEEAYVTIEVSDNSEGNFTVSYEQWDEDMDVYLIGIIDSVTVTDGYAEVSLADLDEIGEYCVYVNYVDGDYFYYNDGYVDVLEDADFEIEVEYYFTDVLVGSDEENEIDWYLPFYATGSVSIILDGDVIDTLYLDDEDYTSYYYLYTDELEIGTHTVEVLYESDDYNSSSDVREFEVTSAIISIPDEVVYGYWDDSIIVYVNEDATGTITVLLDDDEYYTAELEEGYIGYIFDIFEVPVKDYNVTVIYSGDDQYPGVSKSKMVNLSYVIDITGTSIEYGNEEEYYFCFITPDDLGDGDLIVTVDGVAYEYELDDGIFFVPVPDLAYGNHEAIVAYTGDEIYPPQEFNATLEVVSTIQFPEYVEFASTDNYVTVTLPEDATGNLTLYSGSYSWEYLDAEYSTFEIDVEMASVEIEDGIGAICLDGLALGDYEFMAVYEGNYNTITQYSSLSSIPRITVPRVVVIGEEAYITIEVPEDMEGTFTVSGEIWDEDEFEYYYVDIGSADVEDGFAAVLVSDLEENDYEITLEFDSEDYYYEDYGILYVVETTDFDFNVIYDFTDVLIYSEYPSDLYWDVPGYATGNVTIVLDGDVIDVVDIEDSYGYELYTEDLDYGAHLLEVLYESDEYGEGYSSKEFNVTTAVIYIPDEVVYGYWDESIEVYVNPDARGNIIIFLDDEVYVNETLDGYYGYGFDIFDVPVRDYNVTVIYTGDKNYDGVTASKIVHLSYAIYIFHTVIEYGDEDEYYVAFEALSDMDSDKFTVTVDGEIYNATFEDDVYIINVTGLEFGEHDLAVEYLGDDIYPDETFEDTLSVESNIYIPEYWGSEEDIHLILPGDAKGKLIIDISTYEYDDEYDDETLTPYLHSEVPLRNGKAVYDDLDFLEYGIYYIECSFEGNYEIEDASQYFIMIPEIYWVNETNDDEYYFFPYGKNATMAIDTPGWEGEYAVTIELITEYGFFDIETEFISTDYVELTGGSATFDLPELLLGDYIISVEDTEHEEVLYQFTVYITPYEINVPEVINLNDPGNVTVVMPEDTIGNVTVEIYILEFDEEWGDYFYEIFDEFNATFEDGIAVAYIPELFEGEYAFVVYTTTENYGAYYEAFEEITTDYLPIDSRLNVTVTDISVGEDETVDITIDDRATGKIIVDGEEINITEGSAKVIISNLLPGQHNITVVFDGDELFKAANYTATFSVSKYEPSINVTASEALAGDDLEVSVEIENATGNVTINGVDVALIDGKANLTIEKVAAGNLTIEVDYAGDDRFLNASVSKTVEIMARDANLTAAVADVSVGEDAVVNITINENVTGNVTVDGVSVEIINGTGTFVISNLTAGQYNVTVAFEGDEYFAAANATAAFKVNKLTPEITLTPGVAIEGADLNINVDIADATGNVIVNGRTFELVDGKAVAVVENLTAGEKVIRVTYSGDDKYTNAAESIRVTVSPKKNANLKVSVEDITVGENATVNVEISRDATGNVTVNGVPVEITNGKGSYVISGLDVGEYNVTAVFEGDKYFAPANATATFNVSKAAIDPETSPFVAGNDSNATTYTINLPSDAEGNFTVEIANKTFTKELVNGTATVEITDVAPGEYEVKLTFSGDGKYLSITETVNVTIEVDPRIDSSDMKVRYLCDNSFEVTVYGKDGKAAANTEVVFKLDGKDFLNITTDENGTASFRITQTPGTYNVTAEALGVTAANQLVVKHVLKLKKVKVKKSAKKLVLTAKIKKVDGKYLKGAKVKFTFNGKKYKAKTNKKGVAKVTIKSNVLSKLKVGKKIKIKAKYAKDVVKRTAKVKR